MSLILSEQFQIQKLYNIILPLALCFFMIILHTHNSYKIGQKTYFWWMKNIQFQLRDTVLSLLNLNLFHNVITIKRSSQFSF